MTTYAVAWREDEGEVHAGKLDLAHDGVVLSGSGPDAPESHRRLPYEDVAGAHVERRDGPRLVLLGPGGNRVEIASLDGAGALHELAERLALARGAAR